MHRLFSRQLAKARTVSGEVDLDVLDALVTAAYDQNDRDRRRTDRSIALMIEELDQLNRGLEHLIAERTAALQEREQQLRAQNLRFHAALNNMSQGLMMYDADGRLVIGNHRYHELYGSSPDVIKPGCTIRDVFAHRKQNGTFPDDPDRHIAKLMTAVGEGRMLNRFVELSDGRTIAVLMRPMPDGGWVATHEDVTERRRAERQIAHMARHDALTNLPNRMLLRERLSQALTGVERGERIAVLYLDLDLFKTVNDTLGHPIGDELLKVVAGRLRCSIRDVDTVARVGGDEFAIIQTAAKCPVDTAFLARRLCDAVQAPYNLHGHGITLDTSIGIALAPADGTDPDLLLRHADMALYRAKADGRGTFRFFEPAMDAQAKARRVLEVALRDALPGGQFELHYQPLVNLKDRRVTCCEALLRWNHPERGLTSPADFIPVAEEIGMIVPLGEWVLRKACADAARWPQEIKVAVNLSPIQVMNHNLVSVIDAALAAAGLPPDRLEIEITESVLMRNTETTLAALHRLRALGVRISMDDFGTGYSSLSYLRSFPFDKIKIDRCFISGLSEGDDSVPIVLAIAGLANNLGISTTAEGVETTQQLQQVRALGCTEMQGFLFSPPRHVDEIMRMFRSPLHQEEAATEAERRRARLISAGPASI